MKKALLLIVLVVLCAGMVFAAPSTRFTKYGNIFISGDFTIKGTVSEMDSSGNRTGQTSPVTIALHAGEYYMQSSDEGVSVRVILKSDGKMYMIEDTSKTMMVLPADGAELMKFPPMLDYNRSGFAKFDGRALYYETVKEDDKETTYWFNGYDLYAIQENSDSQNTAVFITSITQKADASLFVLPVGYETMDLTSLADSLGSAFESTDVVEENSDGDWLSSLEDVDWENLFGSFDFDPHYYAFAIMMGLSDAQARDFEQTIEAFNNIDWSALNECYDKDSGRYDLKGKTLANAGQVSVSEAMKIQQMMDKFKK